MKELSRSELKELCGGQVPPEGGTMILMGWRWYNGQCYCDWHVDYGDGSYADHCDILCAPSNCGQS